MSGETDYAAEKLDQAAQDAVLVSQVAEGSRQQINHVGDDLQALIRDVNVNLMGAGARYEYRFADRVNGLRQRREAFVEAHAAVLSLLGQISEEAQNLSGDLRQAAQELRP